MGKTSRSIRRRGIANGTGRLVSKALRKRSTCSPVVVVHLRHSRNSELSMSQSRREEVRGRQLGYRLCSLLAGRIVPLKGATGTQIRILITVHRAPRTPATCLHSQASGKLRLQQASANAKASTSYQALRAPRSRSNRGQRRSMTLEPSRCRSRRTARLCQGHARHRSRRGVNGRATHGDLPDSIARLLGAHTGLSLRSSLTVEEWDVAGDCKAARHL